MVTANVNELHMQRNVLTRLGLYYWSPKAWAGFLRHDESIPSSIFTLTVRFTGFCLLGRKGKGIKPAHVSKNISWNCGIRPIQKADRYNTYNNR